MSEADNTPAAAEPSEAAEITKAGAGFLRYVEDNPLASIAGALIVGVILARFAFLGSPKEG